MEEMPPVEKVNMKLTSFSTQKCKGKTLILPYHIIYIGCPFIKVKKYRTGFPSKKEKSTAPWDEKSPGAAAHLKSCEGQCSALRCRIRTPAISAQEACVQTAPISCATMGIP